MEYRLSQLDTKQWKMCNVNEKVVYPIAKKRVVGATQITNETYNRWKEFLNKGSLYDIYDWTLTIDDYIIAVKSDSQILHTEDLDLFCFICY